MEVLRDASNGTRTRNKRVLLINGFDPIERILDFKPEGIVSGKATESARRKHFSEYSKNANQMRKEFINMTKADGHLRSEKNSDGNLQIVMDEQTEGDAVERVKSLADQDTEYFEISNKKGHFADLLKAFKLASEKKKVVVYFRGVSKDPKGNPTVDLGTYPEVPTNQNGPRENIKDAVVKIAEYIEEVNQMRELLVQYIDEDSDTDIASSQEEAFDLVVKNMEIQKSLSGRLIPFTPAAQ